MEKLEIAKFLIEEAIEEKKRLEEYEDDLKVLDAAASELDRENYTKLSNEFWGKFKTIPKKSKIARNCVKARELLNDVRKGYQW